MADLTEVQSSLSVKIAGAGPSTGIEDNYLDVDTTGRITIKIEDTSGSSVAAYNSQLEVSDVVNGGGSNGAITVGTTALLVSVSGTNLANRKSLTLYNNGNTTMYWGLSSSVTTTNGTPIPTGYTATWKVGVSTTIYIISASAAQNARVTEMA